VTGADQILLAREKGIPVVAIAVIYRKSPFVLFSLSDSKISKPQDFIGKKVGVKLGGNEELTYRATMKKAGVDTSRVIEIPVKFDITPLLTREVDVWPGYAINEPITAEEEGYNVTLIWPSDYGINLYADTLFTTEDMIKNNPELVQKFVDATLEGWNYAYNNPNEAVNYTLMYSDQLNKEHETKMMLASLGSLKPDVNKIGYMEKGKWEEMQQLLIENGFMKQSVEIDNAYTNQFLK
jgi:NitT/TauT family transport system substrate-binding protein